MAKKQTTAPVEPKQDQEKIAEAPVAKEITADTSVEVQQSPNEGQVAENEALSPVALEASEPVPVVENPVAEAPVVANTIAEQAAEAMAVSDAQALDISTFSGFIQNLKNTGSAKVCKLIFDLDSYIVDMAPGKIIDNVNGARKQQALWNCIKDVLEKSTFEEFSNLWGVILAYFDNYQNTVLHDRYIFRFAESWQYSNQELSTFHRVLNLIRLTHSPAERSIGLKQLDMAKTLEKGLTEAARQKVINFYSR